MGAWADLLAAVDVAVQTTTDLMPSPIPFSARNIPETLTGRVFAVDLQTRDTGKDRGANRIRAAHTLTVELLHSVPTAGDWRGMQREALDDELGIIEALLTQSSFSAYRVQYLTSRRTPTPTWTHMLTSMTFDLEHTIGVL